MGGSCKRHTGERIAKKVGRAHRKQNQQVGLALQDRLRGELREQGGHSRKTRKRSNRQSKKTEGRRMNRAEDCCTKATTWREPTSRIS